MYLPRPWEGQKEMARYTCVPPPDQPQSQAASIEAEVSETDYTKPDNVANEQWKKFQELKVRRMKECGHSERQRIVTLKSRALKSVSRELSEMDKQLLAKDGVSIPDSGHPRKRKRAHHQSESSIVSQERPSIKKGDPVSNELEVKWNEVKRYMDPNPQLRGLDQGKYADKSLLEEKMGQLIEQGQLEEAAAMSDKLAQRDFALNVATAFDCREYAEMKKTQDEKKKASKRKSKSSFPPKQRWECKGNM